MVEKKELIEDTTLSNRVKGILIYQGNIKTIFQLLNADCEDLKKLRGMGKKNLQEVKDFVHSLGYEIMNERGPFSTMEESLIVHSRKPLSFYGFSMELCKFLYQHNLFTIEDLIQCGSSIYQIDGMYASRVCELKERLTSLGVDLPYQKNKSLKLLDQVASKNFTFLSKEKKKDILNQILIEELDGLDNHIKKVFLFNGIDTLGELLQYSLEDIRRFRNMGDTSLSRLISYFSSYGLELFTKKQMAKKKFDKKLQLIGEYNDLVFEKQKLMDQLQKIERQLECKRVEIHSYKIEEEKSLTRIKKRKNNTNN